MIGRDFGITSRFLIRGLNIKKLLALAILICLISLTVFGQEKNYQMKTGILKTYGEPFWKGEGKQREVWYYPRQRMFIYFEGDRAIEIDVIAGEKT